MGLLSGAVILLGIMACQSVSQEKAQPQAPAAQPQAPAAQPQAPRVQQQRGVTIDPAELHKQMMNRIRENLKATDEEWKVIAPKIEKVRTLQIEMRPGAGMFNMRQGQRAGEQISDIEKKAGELQKLLSDQTASEKAIKKALKELHSAGRRSRQKQPRPKKSCGPW